MMNHRDVRLMFYEYLRGELTATERSSVGAHLDSCNECAAELHNMRETLSLLPIPATRASEERSQEFWNAFASNVTKRAIRKRWNPLAELAAWIEESLLLRPRYTYAVMGSVAALLGGVAFWTFFMPEQRHVATNGTSVPLDHPASMEQMYGDTGVPVERVNQYFRKSKTLLVGLANMKTVQGEPLDLSTERRVSRDLIREARYLRQQPIDPRSRRLMKDLERILIEFENLEEQNDLPDVEIIRGGIHQENLLFKIRMAEAMYDSTGFIYTSERR